MRYFKFVFTLTKTPHTDPNRTPIGKKSPLKINIQRLAGSLSSRPICVRISDHRIKQPDGVAVLHQYFEQSREMLALLTAEFVEDPAEAIQAAVGNLERIAPGIPYLDKPKNPVAYAMSICTSVLSLYMVLYVNLTPTPFIQGAFPLIAGKHVLR